MTTIDQDRAARQRTQTLTQIEADPIVAYYRQVKDKAAYLREIPDYMRPGVVRYVLLGIRPGRFLCAILSNERELAERAADDLNRDCFHLYDKLMTYGMPRESYGSADAVRAWCEKGGMVGREA